MSKKQQYTNGEITVVWEADKCIHSGNCVRGLPDAFKPKERPWVQLESVESQAVWDTVQKCPSGALTVFRNAEAQPEAPAERASVPRIQVVADGPLLVRGPITVELPDGSERTEEKRAALCRCGSSDNKPFCDGTHRKIGFAG